MGHKFKKGDHVRRVIKECTVTWVSPDGSHLSIDNHNHMCSVDCFELVERKEPVVFKVGDIVRQKRTSNGTLPYNGFTPGSNYNLPDSNGVVVYASNNRDPYNGQAITIDYNGVISPPVNSNCFELVEQEKPKPWLKITPPQPEKRELVACRLLNGLFITPHDPAIRMAVTTQGVSVHYDKDQLRELGETLIEISKEMK